MNRGYAGFYKGHYLRSSYEYAYAKYLDHHSIPWSYEDCVFDIGYKLYKPDFFLYDQKGKLVKIVEIKSRSKDAKKNAREALNIIEEQHHIKCELISYEELLDLYKTLPFSLTSTIEEWIKSENTTISKVAYGELNGHYNLKHDEETKKKIGEHTRSLWLSNGIAKQRMLEGLKKSGLAQKGKIKKPRETRTCEECGKIFKVIITSKQKFCSRTCAGHRAIRHATNTYVEIRSEVHHNIREYIIKWARENSDIVVKTPLNKIKTTIQSLIRDIEREFQVKDLRVISKSVFGEDRGRKELIKFMKSVCNEDVC